MWPPTWGAVSSTRTMLWGARGPVRPQGQPRAADPLVLSPGRGAFRCWCPAPELAGASRAVGRRVRCRGEPDSSRIPARAPNGEPGFSP